MIISFGLVEAAKAINFDKISLCIGFSKYHNGLAILLKIPGFSKYIDVALDGGKPFYCLHLKEKLKKREK